MGEALARLVSLRRVRSRVGDLSIRIRLAPRRLLRASLLDPRGLAPQLAQVVKLGPAHMPLSQNLDSIDSGRVQGERPLHPNTVRDLANRERRAEAATTAPNADPFEGLQSLFVTFDYFHLHLDGVSGPEWGQVFTEMLLFDCLDE